MNFSGELEVYQHTGDDWGFVSKIVVKNKTATWRLHV